uniref:Uncharacterized protein n=1 Tax=viral metagenome TaxID=1070528 RepID=A0A6C0KSB7_9ZZZZ
MNNTIKLNNNYNKNTSRKKYGGGVKKRKNKNEVPREQDKIKTPGEEEETKGPDAYRDISVNIESQSENQNEVATILGDKITCSKKDGTPQKRLLYLAIACKQIIANNLKQNKSNCNYDDLIKFMSDQKDEEEGGEKEKKNESSRGWWNKTINSTKKDCLCEMVNICLNFFINDKNNGEEYNAALIASLWSIIMVKSMSDISQMGQLINSIPLFNQTQNTNDLPLTKTIFNQINKNAKIGFVSSDKICAGVSSLLINDLDYPIETLCTRKSSVGGKTTQNIIIQKGIIASLTFFLYQIEISQEKTDIIQLFSNLEETLILDSKYMISKILYYYNEYVSKLNRFTTIEREFNELFAIKRKENNISIYDSYDDRFINLSNFIKGISSVLKAKRYSISKSNNITNEIKDLNLSLFNKLKDTLFLNKTKFRSPKWCYYVANDIFRLIYPQNEINFEDLKTIISKSEIKAATIDGTYGHDFHGIDCITRLGEEFMKIAKYKDSMLVDKKNENEAIKNCLKNSKCVTIDQIQDDLSINFNTDTNYLPLTTNTNIGNPQYWHFFDSLFSLKPLILAIDFTKGNQPYSDIVAEQFSATSESKEADDLINPIQPNELQEIISQQIKKNGTGRELMGTCALFDGAASYGIYPYYLTDDNNNFLPYISELIIDYDYVNSPSFPPQKKQKNQNLNTDTEKKPLIKVKFETYSKLNALQLEDRYKTTLIPSILTPIEGVFEELLKLYPDNKQEFDNALINLDSDDRFCNAFSQLWAELLNLKTKENMDRGKGFKIKLDNSDLKNLIKGFNIYFINKYGKTNTQVPNFLQEIQDILLAKGSNTLDESTNRFNQIMAIIIHDIANPEFNEVNKKVLLQILSEGIDFAGNNKSEKRILFGKREDEDITSGIEEIERTEPDKIDSVLNYFMQNKEPSAIANPYLESISEGLMEGPVSNIQGTPPVGNYIKTKAESLSVLERGRIAFQQEQRQRQGETGSNMEQDQATPEKAPESPPSSHFTINTNTNTNSQDVATQQSQSQNQLMIEDSDSDEDKMNITGGKTRKKNLHPKNKRTKRKFKY